MTQNGDLGAPAGMVRMFLLLTSDLLSYLLLLNLASAELLLLTSDGCTMYHAVGGHFYARSQRLFLIGCLTTAALLFILIGCLVELV